MGTRAVGTLRAPMRRSVSGHPGSPHYDDQIQPWSEGKLHYIALAAENVDGPRLTLHPE